MGRGEAAGGGGGGVEKFPTAYLLSLTREEGSRGVRHQKYPSPPRARGLFLTLIRTRSEE